MNGLVIVMVALATAACSHVASDTKAPHVASDTKTPAAVEGAASNLYRFQVGSLEAIALKDGDISVPNDGRTVGVGQPKEEVAALLVGAGRSPETIDFSIQPLVVRDGARILLFDAGAADASFAKAGRLPESLRSAGISPAHVTDVFISHGHPDHVGGLVTREDTPAFANARIHISVPEWAAMRANTEQAKLVSVIASQVDAFPPNATILPSVTAVAVRGHTPGHTAYRIASGSETLLVIGDTAHHSIVSVQRPDWTIEFDRGGDPGAAQASRRALLEQASQQHLRLYAGHFPFPGLGRVRKEGRDFVWVPEASVPSAGPSK
jgi:glyoxylase-like metal-dependent hydrolase (beta-lactamase superfamily II)